MNRKLTRLLLVSAITALAACGGESGVVSNSGDPINQTDGEDGDGDLAEQPDGADGGSDPNEQPDGADGGSDPNEQPEEGADGGSDPDEQPEEGADGGSVPDEQPEGADGGSDPNEQPDGADGGNVPDEQPDGADGGSDPNEQTGGADGGGDPVEQTGGTDGDGDVVIAAAGEFRVTITNLTTGQPISPPVVVLHDVGTHLFQIGEAASPELRAIAEEGDNEPMVALASSLDAVSAVDVVFGNPAAPGPLFPGETASVTLETAVEGQVLSIANMLVCTNDGFSGVDSLELPTGLEPLVFEARAFDAGTENNILDANYWVPSCGGSGANLHTDEGGLTGPHPGQSGTGTFDFDGSASVIRVVVERIERIAGTFNVAFTNLSIGQPISPPVAMIHNPDVIFIRTGTESGPELQAIAEDGNNDPMLALANSLDEVSAVGVAFVDAANPSPISPGETATVTLETDDISEVFSAVAMIVCTNDAYSAASARALPVVGEPLIIEAIPYDAGTEVNTLNADYWVPPCGGNGENLHEDEGAVSGAHPGQTGVGNFDFPSVTAIMRIEVTRQ